MYPKSHQVSLICLNVRMTQNVCPCFCDNTLILHQTLTRHYTTHDNFPQLLGPANAPRPVVLWKTGDPRDLCQLVHLAADVVLKIWLNVLEGKHSSVRSRTSVVASVAAPIVQWFDRTETGGGLQIAEQLGAFSLQQPELPNHIKPKCASRPYHNHFDQKWATQAELWFTPAFVALYYQIICQHILAQSCPQALTPLFKHPNNAGNTPQPCILVGLHLISAIWVPTGIHNSTFNCISWGPWPPPPPHYPNHLLHRDTWTVTGGTFCGVSPSPQAPVWSNPKRREMVGLIHNHKSYIYTRLVNRVNCL